MYSPRCTLNTLTKMKHTSGSLSVNPKVFPTILIILDVCAAVPYAMQKDLRMTVYWLSAALLGFSLTWL